MKLNFNVALTDLEGKPQAGETLGQRLSGFMVNGNKGPAIKFYDWGRKMYNGEALDLDRADQKVLKEFIENHEYMAVILKAQCLEVFDKNKEEQ